MHDKLAAIADLTKGSKLNRIISNPIGYWNLLVQTKIKYPITKKGTVKICKTFFDTKMKVILPAGLDLYLTGAKTHDSELRLAQFLIKNLKEGDNFLDIGGHFGYFTLLASKLLGPNGQVICVEASAEMYKILNHNTQAHSNIQINHLAASDKKEVIEFHEFPIYYSEYNSLDIEQYKNESWFKTNPPKKISVNAIPLDELLFEKHFDPKIIKIDVEGAEEKVINGLKNTLAMKSVDAIAMEFILNSKNNAHLAAAKTLNKYQYYPHFIQDDGNLNKITLDQIEPLMHQKNRESDNIIFSCK